MKKQYHILNGDSLKEQFPKSLEGEVIVARECLVDGDVQGTSLDEFFQTRARFISQTYEGYEEDGYFKETLPEFQKMQNIEMDSDVFLWFEDDLFCQVNFWFVINLLHKSARHNSIYLVRPSVHTQYGFSAFKPSELITLFESKLQLNRIDELAQLWEFYQKDDFEGLFQMAQELHEVYPFLIPAVKAHLERRPSEGNPGRPMTSLAEIMKELQTKEFGPVFREFCKRESIYGFGDLQVKRLFDQAKQFL